MRLEGRAVDHRGSEAVRGKAITEGVLASFVGRTFGKLRVVRAWKSAAVMAM